MAANHCIQEAGNLLFSAPPSAFLNATVEQYLRRPMPAICRAHAELTMPNQRSLSLFARTLFAATLLCTLFAATLAAHAEGPYKILNHWKLPDAGGWDYLLVDSADHRDRLAQSRRHHRGSRQARIRRRRWQGKRLQQH